MRFTKTFFSMGALAGLVALSVFAGPASAAAPNQTQTPPNPNPDRPRPVRFVGQVDRVSDRGVILSMRGGMTVTALVSTGTWILVEQNGACTEGTLRDIQTGRPAAVAGMTTRERGVINARQIAQCRAGDADVGNGPAREKAKQELSKHVGAGTIKSVNGSTLTITTLKGQELTVNTTADTVVLNNGFGSASALKVGDKVEVFGRPEKADKSATPATRTITAWAVRVDNGTTRLMLGRVDSVSGNTVTLKTPKHREGTQVTLDSKTGYKAVTVANKQVTFGNATQADVKAGSNLIVEGVASADGKTFTAGAVIILPGGKTR